VFTRDKPMAEKAREIEPIDQDDDFSVRFRFRAVGRGTYAAVIYVGVRQSGSEWDANGVGVFIFRHSEKLGLVGAPFMWDCAGKNQQNRKTVSLEYDTVYDATCVYSGARKTLSVTFNEVVNGETAGTRVIQIPEDAKWSADRLACWNHADGHSPNMRLTVLIDQLRLNDDTPLQFAKDLSDLPFGDDRRFTWHQAPLPPLISGLTAPREVLAGEETKFIATTQPGLAGTVHFSLKTYAGDAVWRRSAPVEDGRASVVLGAEEAAQLGKGSRVLMATLNDKTDRSAYAAVRLRGRIFRDVTEAPTGLKPGDEIVIDDLSLVQPASAVSGRSVKGKWWLRRYTVSGESQARALLSVEEHDLNDPASCLAPSLRLPLDLEGWYEVWVRTYRQSPGGIDVRLSEEPWFWHARPHSISSDPTKPIPPQGTLVDLLYRAADLTGQDLVFQQPYGTYASNTKSCAASLAGVRLVKLSGEQVERVLAERARTDTPVIGYDNDGYSYFWLWGTHDRTCISRLLEPLRDRGAAFLNIELGGLGGLTIPTPYTGMYQMSRGHVRDGDRRANAFFRWSFDRKVDILRVLAERARETDVKIFASLMMERCFSWDDVMRSHPEWRVKRGRGTWDYALPAVQDYQVKKITWIIENHDLDGFIVDFTRYGRFFNEDEPRKFERMNEFLRKLRAGVDLFKDRTGRKCLLCASFGDRSWHLTHWGTGVLSEQGLDVATWLKEGIFDMIMPEGPTVLKFIEMAEDSRTQVWLRKVAHVTLSSHKHVRGLLGPKAIEKEVKWALDHGADGIFFFNHEPWGAFRRLAFREELELRTRVDEVYGYRVGPVAKFADWYPSLDERTAQRDAFKPLTIAPDAQHRVDGRLTVPVRNTFPHPINAVISWQASEQKSAAKWQIEPPSGRVSVAPGKEETVAFRLKGTAEDYRAVPVARVEMSAGDQVVFRHRVPLRAVPRLTCHRTVSAPQIDGCLDDAAWAGPVGLVPVTFVRVGQPGAWSTRVAAAFDKTHLYLAYECSGVAAPAIAREPEPRDSPDVYRGDHLQILIDPAAAEQAYLAFTATPAGGQADYRAHYYDFTGQFRRKREWSADWLVGSTRRDDGYALEFAIPFKAIGATPEAGHRWRLNLIAQSRTADGGASIRGAWSSPEKPYHLERHLGTLHGSLVFTAGNRP